MRRLGPRSACLLLALTLAPFASAEPVFPGTDRLELEISEDGTTRATITHDYSADEWLRTYELSVDWSRVGVYPLQRVPGADAFAGSGEEHVEAVGSLRISVMDQGYESVLVCDLEFSKTRAAQAILGQINDTLVLTAGRGMLDADVWSCDDSGVQSTVHGGAGDIVVAGYALGGAEGLVSGQFPAQLAVFLGFASSEEDWAKETDKEEHIPDLLRMAYVEAEPTLGKQTVPFSRTYAVSSGGVDLYACPEMGVTDTPSTSGDCKVESTTQIEISRPGSTGSTAPAQQTGANTDAEPAGSAGGNASPAADTPGAPLAAVAAAIGGAALLARRREA